MNKSIKSRSALLASVVGPPSIARAHHAELMTGEPFLQGISMPIHGLDHMLVALALGRIAVTNQVGFLNRQMTQINADGEKDKQTATVVNALVPRPCDRQAVGPTASTTTAGPGLDSRRLVFLCVHLRGSADCLTNPVGSRRSLL